MENIFGHVVSRVATKSQWRIVSGQDGSAVHDCLALFFLPDPRTGDTQCTKIPSKLSSTERDLAVFSLVFLFASCL